TTGLAGGTGTYVFLIGLAHIANGELVLRQHLLRDISAENEFVEHLKRELEPYRACASYNGKTFDIPLLRTRFVMAIRSELTVDESHLDLLHPARRLWKDRFGSTTLRQLEDSILDDGRVADIPGSCIPDAYFHYLRRGDEAIIAPVITHNARDVISLVRIADRVAGAVLDARTGPSRTRPRERSVADAVGERRRRVDLIHERARCVVQEGIRGHLVEDRARRGPADRGDGDVDDEGVRRRIDPARGRWRAEVHRGLAVARAREDGRRLAGAAGEPGRRGIGLRVPECVVPPPLKHPRFGALCREAQSGGVAHADARVQT